MYVALGDETTRKVDKDKFLLSDRVDEYYPNFFSKKTLTLIHRLVHEYYTSYKNVVKLFVTGEVADLFNKEIKTKKKAEQKLVVFPDVRTMDNHIKTNPAYNSLKEYVILNGTSTQVQKDKARRGIKTGQIQTLFCTPSQLFQDRKNLTEISLIDTHQRYYKSQQDPRYDTREICKKLAEIHKATLNTTGIQILD